MNKKILAAPILAAAVGAAAYLGTRDAGRDTDMDGGGRGRDDEGNYLSVTTLFGKVDGDVTTVGDIVSFAPQPGNYELVSNLAVHAVSAPEGYVTNILARRVSAEIPYTYGNSYEYATWKQIFLVTLLNPVGDFYKGGEFRPSETPVTAHVYILNAERYEHYDPGTGTWVYDDSWTTNSFYDGVVTFTKHDYSHDQQIEIQYTANQGDFSAEISLSGPVGGSLSCMWYNSNSWTWDYGSIIPGRIANIVDTFLTEDEIRKVVPVIHEEQTTTLIKSNTVYSIQIESNVITKVVKETTEVTNRVHDVWHELTREVAITNVPLASGQVFAGLVVSETNLVGILPLQGTTQVAKIEAPYRQGYYTPSLFSAIQIGTPHQAAFSYRMQLAEGLWLPNPNRLRFYDQLTTNEEDHCYSLRDVLNEISINAIREELRSGYVSSHGGTYDENFSFGSVGASGDLIVSGSATLGSTTITGDASVSGNATVGGTLTAGSFTSGQFSTGVGTFDEVRLPQNGFHALKFGETQDLTGWINEKFGNFRSNPYGLQTLDGNQLVTENNVLALMNENRLRYPRKNSKSSTEERWMLEKDGCTYTISTNFYYNVEYSSQGITTVYINFPDMSGFSGLTYGTTGNKNWDITASQNGTSFRLYVESLPLGVILYLPLRVYQHNGWTIRFTGDSLSEVLGVGDVLRVFSCDDNTIIIEKNHTTVYTGEQ